MSVIAFAVTGTVPVPQGSKRIGRHGTRPVILDDNDKTLRLWRARVAAEFTHAAGDNWSPLDEPVSVRAQFYFPRPKSNRYGTWKATAPDVDKLCRAVLDGLADADAYVNDSRVVELIAHKMYVTDGQDPGAAVMVGPLAGTA